MAIKNTYTVGTENIYDPTPRQTLFLGCSVSSFSCTLGWNNQATEVSVSLVPDPCSNPSGKIYYNYFGNQLVHYDADPAYTDGFVGDLCEIVGCPVFFRMGNFEFCGIIQSWEEQRSTSAYPTYSVRLTDPRLILDGAQLILNDYAGSVYTSYNVFNVYGFLEQFGEYSPPIYLSALPPNGSNYIIGNGNPDGAVMGSPAYGYGGAITTNNGMLWSLLKNSIYMLTSAIPAETNLFSPYGRISFRGAEDAYTASVNGCGLLNADTYDGGLPISYYVLDLSTLPSMPTDWRINGSTISISEVINQVCEAASYDYFITLAPIHVGADIIKLINVKTVSKLYTQSLDAINNFIVANTGTAISTSRGRELRNEPTSSFIVGGKKQNIYQLECSESGFILPYFGLDWSGNAIIPTGDQWGNWEFDAPCENLISRFKVFQSNRVVLKLNEVELQCASAGFDSWSNYVSSVKSDTYKLLWEDNNHDIPSTFKDMSLFFQELDTFITNMNTCKADPQKNDDQKQQCIAGHARIFVNKVANVTFASNDTYSWAIKNEDMNQVYDFVNRYANEYYGRKFQVLLPYSAAKRDVDNYQVTNSEVPLSDGYTEQTGVLGLPNPGLVTNFFTTDNNKLKAFVRFDKASGEMTEIYVPPVGGKGIGNFQYRYTKPAIDMSNISTEEYAIVDDSLYLGISVDEKIVYSDWTTLANPRIVIDIGSPIRQLPTGGLPQGMNILMKLAEEISNRGGEPQKITSRQSGILAMFSNLGNKSIFGPIVYPFVTPSAVAIGLQSSNINYGPWGVHGLPGQTIITYDEGLVPWEYQNSYYMNVVASGLTQEGIVNSQVVEMGTIVLPGYPTLPLGAEIGSSFTEVKSSLIEHRTGVVSTYNNTLYNGNPFSADYYLIGADNVSYSGINGPCISNVNVEVGANGVQTTYQLRTYTPRFGRFAKYNAERTKIAASNNFKLQKTMRTLAVLRNKYDQYKGH